MAINPSDASTLNDTFSPHVMAGVDKLHAEGLAGKGITIGIIDSGVDYTHPALGGGFGPGFKIIGGYDFVGEESNGADSPKPDNDVRQPSQPLNAC
jgi:subtilisin family serine protease